MPRVETLPTLNRFVAAAWPLLVSDEAHHTIVLAALQTAQRVQAAGKPDAATTPWRSAVAWQDGGPVAAALRSRGNWLLTLGPQQAMAALGAALAAPDPTAPAERGIVGPAGLAEAFATAVGMPVRTEMTLPLLKLMQAPDGGPAPAAGRLQWLDQDITPAHWQQLREFTFAFHDEARLTDPREQVEHNLRERLPQRSLALWLDSNECPVCLVGASLIAPTGARIGPVYTPPAQRGRGYARAAVSTACDVLLAQGAAAIYLFTDATNPTSNALYRKIGFGLIGEHRHLARVSTAA